MWGSCDVGESQCVEVAVWESRCGDHSVGVWYCGKMDFMGVMVVSKPNFIAF